MTDMDRKLAALLLGDDRGVDAQFSERVRQAVLFEQRVRAARILLWKKFAADVLASAGVVFALLVLTRLPMPASAVAPAPFGSAALALIIIGIWTAVTLRPETHSG